MWNFPDADDREVTSISINSDGYVSRVWNDDGLWPSQDAADVILDLEIGEHAYYVCWPEGPVQIIDATDSGGRYLAAIRSGSNRNALLSLPRHEEKTARERTAV